MTGKLPLLLGYAALGLLIALWPLTVRRATTVAAAPIGSAFAGIAAGLLVSTVLPWWRREGGWPAVSLFEVAFVLAAAALVGASMLRGAARAADVAVRRWQDAVFAAAVVGLGFSTLTYVHPEVQAMAWHHWGAYIGPAELLLAGARIFRDFPPQYGLGPTLLIAAGCGETCWTWMYWVVGALTVLFGAGIARLALHAAGPLRADQRALVLLACLACCFLWDAFPPLLGSPTATPSVNGMRFLPALGLAWLLVRWDRDERPFPAFAGHAAWAAAALWSVESAFYASCLWWPHYLLLRRRAGVLLVLVAAWLLAFVAVYAAVYGTAPTLRGLFAYIVDPPGALPVNPAGAVWTFVAAMALGLWVNVRAFRSHGNTAETRRGLVLLLLAYAAFSYFLGRSHDNNVLNVLAFAVPVLLHAWARTTGFARGVAVGLIAALLGWTMTFNWAPWQAGLAAPTERWFDPQWFRHVLPSDDPAQAAFPAETKQVIARAISIAPDPVTVLGPYANPSSPAASAVWSALHGPANVSVLTSPVRREFLARTAASLRRSGWLLVQSAEPRALAQLPDFDAVYTRNHAFEMAGYLAIHYVPRTP